MVLQNDRVTQALDVCVVAPLVRTNDFDPPSRLTPRFMIEDEHVLLSIAELASVRQAVLGPVVSNQGGRRDDIVAALDLLFTGI